MAADLGIGTTSYLCRTSIRCSNKPDAGVRTCLSNSRRKGLASGAGRKAWMRFVELHKNCAGPMASLRISVPPTPPATRRREQCRAATPKKRRPGKGSPGRMEGRKGGCRCQDGSRVWGVRGNRGGGRARKATARPRAASPRSSGVGQDRRAPLEPAEDWRWPEPAPARSLRS